MQISIWGRVFQTVRAERRKAILIKFPRVCVAVTGRQGCVNKSAPKVSGTQGTVLVQVIAAMEVLVLQTQVRPVHHGCEVLEAPQRTVAGRRVFLLIVWIWRRLLEGRLRQHSRWAPCPTLEVSTRRMEFLWGGMTGRAIPHCHFTGFIHVVMTPSYHNREKDRDILYRQTWKCFIQLWPKLGSRCNVNNAEIIKTHHLWEVCRCLRW